MRFHHAVLALAAMAITSTAPADALARGKATAQPNGYLCCNMRAVDNEIYDINYEGDDAVVLPFGTPVTVTFTPGTTVWFGRSLIALSSRSSVT